MSARTVASKISTKLPGPRAVGGMMFYHIGADGIVILNIPNSAVDVEKVWFPYAVGMCAVRPLVVG